MRLLKAMARQLTAPREGSGFVMRWDCPFCPALFRSAEAAARHFEGCEGE